MRSHYPFYAVNVGGERSVVESYDEAKTLINEVSRARTLPTLRTAVATRVTLPLRPAGSVSAASSQSVNDDELREAKKAKKRELAALNDNSLPPTEDHPLPAIWNDDPFSLV
ncbi:hypothetical protein HG530_001695 [Fusarium avenaceum]|nr:hypothetical protein HG530_001695 [Fusarium avenaceum]